MLDSETKRQIDSCRDILVGKVPNPQAQVEQITIALIYKFMDDMDAEAVELGGKRSFFVGEFAKYAWTKLMAPKMGGHDVLTLYSEAIAKMSQNKGIPPLFREIFKNAFLPYRDPETLRLFLKEINSFHYSHSEKLGDAFEYLLSVLGSQGDAGQFRTPRHIIDFMVEVMDPKKNETILDPACGTAGFLISSYKHILKSNTKKRPGDLLTADERACLAKNIQGYDISPDMVRLSLVNLYLHGFANPRIEEYDTLTSDDKWNELSDLILANPPFMSPKGGIKPHKRFSVQASKSEVLFVDYMAEHLTPNGRAAIVVPEGIIFQSGTAYKQLREMLVKNSLVAVVSLPAGVFNPYSGVKTSILILDKRLSKKIDSVLFVKVGNDGFGLGAQRRAVENSDLPKTVEILHKWLGGKKLKDGEGLVVEKSRIGETGEWNLSGERYEVRAVNQTQWPIVPLSEIADLINGYAFKSENMCDRIENEQYMPVVKIGCITREGFVDVTDSQYHKYSHELAKFVLCSGDLVVAMTGATVGKVARVKSGRLLLNQRVGAVRAKPITIQSYLYCVLFSHRFYDYCQSTAGGGAQGNISPKDILNFEIPLPPLDVQKQVVAEIEGYQKIIDGARMVVENYKPQIEIDPEWPVVELGEVCEIGGEITKKVNLQLPYIGADSIESNSGILFQIKSASEQRVNGPVFHFCGKRLLYSKIRPYLNKLCVVDMEGYCSSDMYPLSINEQMAELVFLKTYLLSEIFLKSIAGYYERASIPKINQSQLFGVMIPLPPLDIQRTIVARIEQEQSLVNSNKELIRIFEEKIKKTIDRVWGE